MVDDFLDSAISAVNLIAVRRIRSKGLWGEVYGSLAYQSVSYAEEVLDYQLAYQQGHGGSWQDISLIIYGDKKPIALWPLSFSIKEGRSMLSSQGLPVLPPVFVENFPPISRKRIIKACQNLANAIAVNAKLDFWESRESFEASLGLSDWHTEAMVRNAVCRLRHELYIDLRQELVEIKKNFRKSYKSLVVSGLRLWTVGVLDSICDNIWEDFKRLHLQVSGRVTRSDETWAIQHQHIKAKRAFLVWLKDSYGKMVGGGFFNYTNMEGAYAVGAYDRSLFDKPLGHVVQYRAIEELKKRNVRWYKIGDRPYTSDVPTPTAKEISIGEFKNGFAMHVFPQYFLTHEVADEAIG